MTPAEAAYGVRLKYASKLHFINARTGGETQARNGCAIGEPQLWSQK